MRGPLRRAGTSRRAFGCRDGCRTGTSSPPRAPGLRLGGRARWRRWPPRARRATSMPSTITPGMPYPAARSTTSAISIALSVGVYSPYMLCSQTNTTGSCRAQAMFAASWNAPMFVEASPKNATETWSEPLYLLRNPAPTAIGTPAPTMPFAPSMPSDRSLMCIDPPLPWQ